MSEAPKVLNRTLAGVREALFEELDRLRNGECDVKRAAATALLCKGIIDSAALQLQYEKAWQEKKISDKLRAIELVPGLEEPSAKRLVGGR